MHIRVDIQVLNVIEIYWDYEKKFIIVEKRLQAIKFSF